MVSGSMSVPLLDLTWSLPPTIDTVAVAGRAPGAQGCIQIADGRADADREGRGIGSVADRDLVADAETESGQKVAVGKTAGGPDSGRRRIGQQRRAGADDFCRLRRAGDRARRKVRRLEQLRAWNAG